MQQAANFRLVFADHSSSSVQCSPHLIKEELTKRAIGFEGRLPPNFW